MLCKLEAFCTEWGLEVNIKQTAVMIFNRSGKQLIESHSLWYGGAPVPSAKTYCYLGITFTITGSFVLSQTHLKQKGTRAYFGLKKQIDLRFISKLAVFKLLDSLIQPIVTYGCPIWIAYSKSAAMIAACGNSTTPDGTSCLTKIATDPCERLHISILKWIMGVNKRTSNAAVWGDCGRSTLLITALFKQSMSYLNRLRLMEDSGLDTFVKHAYYEQRSLQLDWYTICVTQICPELSTSLTITNVKKLTPTRNS